MTQQLVDEVKRGLWHRLAGGEAFGHVPHGSAKRLRLLQRLHLVAAPSSFNPLGVLLGQKTRLNEPGDQILKRREQIGWLPIHDQVGIDEIQTGLVGDKEKRDSWLHQ